MEGGTGGKNNQAGNQSHAGIQHRYADGLSGQGTFFADIASKNCKRTHTDAQGKKRLAHCGKNRVGQTIFP